MTEFNDLTSFVNMISPLILPPDKDLMPNIDSLINYFHNIHKGCKCTINNRQLAANNFYNELGQKLTEPEKSWLKSKLSVPIIAKNPTEIWRIE